MISTIDDKLPDLGDEALLRRTLLEYRAILDNASLGITFTRNHTFLHCNRRFSEMFGWESSELVGQSTQIAFPSQEAFDAFRRTAVPILSDGGRLDTELWLKRRDGGLFWCRMLAKAIDPADHSKGAIYITEDITSRKHDDEGRSQLLLEYQAILDNASLGITFTRNRIFRHCNERFAEMFGRPIAELIGKSAEIVYPSQEAFEAIRRIAKPILSAGRRLDVELQMKRGDGNLFWCRMLAKAIDPTDHSKGTIYITEDITERKAAQEALVRARDELELRVRERTSELAQANARLQAEIQERKLAEQQIRYLANHDALTGLPNRRLLEDRIGQAMERARRSGHQVALLYIDLDDFKPVNDRLGHRTGDLLLQAVAKRLYRLLRAADTVSRVGGDEFVVVLPDMTGERAANDTAQRILDTLARPYLIDEHALQVTPSVGISVFPLDGNDADTLLRRADTAMYFAKRAGRANYQRFHAGMMP